MSIQNKALVIIDMQNDFIDGALANKDTQAIIPKMVKYINNFDGNLIVFTKDTHYDSTYLDSQEGKKLPIKHCIYGTIGWDVDMTLYNAASAWAVNHKDRAVEFIHKRNFGSFSVPEYCRDSEEIIMCGTCTDICVISNVLIMKSTLPETPIKVLKDLCAGTTPEMHNKALDIMKSCQVEVI